MKRVLFGLVLSVGLIVAESNFEDPYIQFSGFKKEELANHLNDPDYSKGMSYLNNKALMQKRKINTADPETQKGKNIISEIDVPDYNGAVESFYQSSQKNRNPVAAYAGNYIIQSYTDKMQIDNLKKFVLFNEIMFEQKNKTCQSYLNMGEIYENGYLRKKDLVKALAIYKEGAKDEKCKKGWTASVLGSKIFRIERTSSKK